MLNFFAPCNFLGYGIHAYNLMKAYQRLYGSDICLIPPFGQVGFQDDLVEKWIKNADEFSAKDPSIMIFQDSYLSQFSGAPRIGFPVFEMQVFPKRSLAMMKSCDYLFVPSQWAASVLNKYGLKNVYVIPEGHDPDLFHANYELCYKQDRIKKNGVTFITVGKWETRKGSQDMLSAFSAAFSDRKEKVTLIAHMQNHFDEFWVDQAGMALSDLGFKQKKDAITDDRKLLGDHVIKASKGNLTIKIPIRSSLTFKGMADLYRSADFGIWLSRAEGWNLPLMECIACGTPALTTCWTGQTEYLDQYPEKLLIKDGVDILASDGRWFKGDRGTWKVPDHDVVVDKLKDIVINTDKYLNLETSCIQSVKDYTWENAAKRLHDVLIQIGAVGE